MRKNMVKKMFMGVLVFLFSGWSYNLSYAQGFSDSMSGTFDVTWEGGTIAGMVGKVTMIGGKSLPQQQPKQLGKGYFKGNKVVIVLPQCWDEKAENNLRSQISYAQGVKKKPEDDPNIVKLAEKRYKAMLGQCEPEQQGPYKIEFIITKDVYDGEFLIRVGNPFKKPQPMMSMGNVPGIPGQQPPPQPEQPKETTGWGDTPQDKPKENVGPMSGLNPKVVNYTKRHFFNFPAPDYKRFDAKKIKDVSIEGKKCEVYFYEPYYYGNRMVWREDTICDGWFPARIYVSEYGEFGGVGGDFTLTASNLKMGEQFDEGVFEIPKDYSVGLQGMGTEGQPWQYFQTFKEAGAFPELPGKLPYCDGAGPGHYVGLNVPVPGYMTVPNFTDLHTFTCDWKPDMVVKNFYDDKFVQAKQGEGFKLGKKMTEQMTKEFQKILQEESKNAKTDPGKEQLKWWADNITKSPTFAFLTPDEKENKVVYLAVMPEFKDPNRSFVYVQQVGIMGEQMQGQQPKKGLFKGIKDLKNIGQMGEMDAQTEGFDPAKLKEKLAKDFSE